jgi:hypothetical protein
MVSVKNERNRVTVERIPSWLVVYPNPAQGLFTINLQQGNFEKVEIIDLLGRRVYAKTIHPNQTILQPKPNLASGSYFVRLINDKDIKIVKLIVQK